MEGFPMARSRIFNQAHAARGGPGRRLGHGSRSDSDRRSRTHDMRSRVRIGNLS